MSISLLRRVFASALILAAPVVPSTALAESVTGTGSFTDRFGWTYTVTVDARGGPFGEGAAGTMSWISIDQAGAVREHWEGDVTCMTVEGNVATVTGTFTYAEPPTHANQGFWLSFEDNGSAGPDRMSWLGFPLFEYLPSLCSHVDARNPVSAGDLTVSASTPVERIAHIDSLVAQLELPPGNGHTLRKTLSDARAALDAGETTQACTDLDRFARDISNTPETKLSADTVARFVGYASRVRAAIGC